jgi:hypothetical protein
MPYRLIFTSERVVAFYPNAKKAFRSGFKLFRIQRYGLGEWKKLLDSIGSEQMVSQGSDGVSDDMLREDVGRAYGSLAYDKIGGVMIRAGPSEREFNLLFRPADKMLIRGLEFCTARSALPQVKSLLGKTALSDRLELQI